MDVWNTSSSVPIFQHAKITFSWFDYAFFSAMLFISAVIGVYFGCFGKKQSTAKEYLLGGKTMKVFPISMSLVATNISGIALLSVPADVYSYGATYWMCCAAVAISCIVTCYVYLPVFYKLQITSTYEYLSMRFDTRIRLFASFLFTLSTILYLPIVIYVPALALGQATNINIHLITPVVCGVCIFYTTLGGLKAVVWTDMLQFSITIGAIIAVLILGVMSAGGVSAIFQKSYEGHRLDIDFDWNPTKRDTFWAMLVGWTFSSISHIAISQHCVQKFMSVPSMEDAKKTCVYYVIGTAIVKSACVFTGLIMYTKYAECDPETSGAIDKPDQILPYYVMEVASEIPGLPGLFISGVFCAALSTLSAVLNCIAGTFYEDFISHFMPKDTTQKTVSNILKLIVLVVGVLSTSLVFVVEHLGSIFPIAMKIGSVANGPLMGIFSLGVLFPKANTKGAMTGGIVSLILTTWLIVGAQLNQVQIAFKPKDTSGCEFTFVPVNSTYVPDEKPVEETFILYRLSHYYYTLTSAFICLIVGLLVSFLTRTGDEPPVSKDLLAPIIYPLLGDDYEKPIPNKQYYSIDKALHIIVSDKEDNEKPEKQ